MQDERQRIQCEKGKGDVINAIQAMRTKGRKSPWLLEKKQRGKEKRWINAAGQIKRPDRQIPGGKKGAFPHDEEWSLQTGQLVDPKMKVYNSFAGFKTSNKRFETGVLDKKKEERR